MEAVALHSAVLEQLEKAGGVPEGASLVIEAMAGLVPAAVFPEVGWEITDSIPFPTLMEEVAGMLIYPSYACTNSCYMFCIYSAIKIGQALIENHGLIDIFLVHFISFGSFHISLQVRSICA